MTTATALRATVWTDRRPAVRVAGAYLCGVLLARLFSPVLPVAAGAFAFPLSALAFPVLFVAASAVAVRPALADRPEVGLPLAVAAGVAGDELVYVALRPDGVGYWSAPSVAGSAALAGATVGIAAAFAVVGDRTRPPAASRRFGWLLAGLVALSVVGFRASQEYLRATGIPNEGRSLVLYGYEIHHGTSGTLLLVVGAVLVATRGVGRGAHRLGALLVATGCGFVADEYPYLFYRQVTDAAYFSPVSYLGAVVSTSIIITVVLYHVRRG